ncbi:MAG: hypothetical protein WC476_11700 [Phycisphaerae bacterium]
MKYTITADSGVSITSSAKTLTGAKREASAWMSYGGGSVYVADKNGPICKRDFWKNLNRFGWSKWINSSK